MKSLQLTFEGFEWDRGNREKSVTKHGISCEEAQEAFFNKPLVYPDEHHSTETERRYVAFGKTREEKRLFISFTLRNNQVRIISARPMSAKERSWYENQKKESLL